MSGESRDIVSGTMLLVDKPLKWTSFDVVNKIRYTIKKTFKLRKIKVGHAGTLDPLATGLLIICTGKMTKKLDSFQAQRKEYVGSITLGAATKTYDAEAPPEDPRPYKHITRSALESQAKVMVGKIQQRPPMYSAIKKDGVPLYKLARAGKEVDIPTREVEIYSFEIERIDLPVVQVRVSCTKGTYIRSLAHDFGKSLGTGAYLSALRRTGIGEYSVRDAWTVPALVKSIETSVL